MVKISVKKDLYLYVYDFIKANQCLPKSFSKQKAFYYTKYLVSEGLVEKTSTGTWAITGKNWVKKSVDVAQRKTRGHGFVFKVSFPQKNNWNKRVQEFNKLGLHFTQLKNCQRMYVLGHKVNIYDESLIIYFAPSTSFYAENSEESSFRAMMECKNVLKRFEKDVNISLRVGKTWLIQEVRSHYADVNNVCAKYYKSKGIDYVPVVMNGKTWALMDNSMNLFELETILGHGQSKEDLPKLTNFLNDIKVNPTTFSKERDGFEEKLLKLTEKLDNLASLVVLSVKSNEVTAKSIQFLINRDINMQPTIHKDDTNLADYFG